MKEVWGNGVYGLGENYNVFSTTGCRGVAQILRLLVDCWAASCLVIFSCCKSARRVIGLLFVRLHSYIDLYVM